MKKPNITTLYQNPVCGLSKTNTVVRKLTTMLDLNAAELVE